MTVSSLKTNFRSAKAQRNICFNPFHNNGVEVAKPGLVYSFYVSAFNTLVFILDPKYVHMKIK